MANEGRFLNKHFIKADGIIANNDQPVELAGGIVLGDGSALTRLVSAATTVTLTHGSTVGSLAHSVSVAVAGVEPGDLILAAPVASLPLGVMWSAACYSAGAVNIRSFSTGSWATAAIAGTSWRILAIRF